MSNEALRKTSKSVRAVIITRVMDCLLDILNCVLKLEWIKWSYN